MFFKQNIHFIISIASILSFALGLLNALVFNENLNAWCGFVSGRFPDHLPAWKRESRRLQCKETAGNFASWQRRFRWIAFGLFPLPVSVANHGKPNNNPGGDCYWAGAQPKIGSTKKWRGVSSITLLMGNLDVAKIMSNGISWNQSRLIRPSLHCGDILEYCVMVTEFHTLPWMYRM